VLLEAPQAESTNLAWPDACAGTVHDVNGISVAEYGSGPDIVLLHGTGAGGHSWRRLIPALARYSRVLVPDLPGHGNSRCPGRDGYTLAAMSRALQSVLADLRSQPRLLVGHSAGAALGAWLMLTGQCRADALVALAPAMLGFRGSRQVVFSALARVMASHSLVPRAIAWRARDRSAVARLLRDVGSPLDQAGIDGYAALLRQPDHVAGVLRMMAQWDLRPLERRLPELADRVLLITGRLDRAVPEQEIVRLRMRLPGAHHVRLEQAGHLLHEERPRAVLAAMRQWAGARRIAL